MRLGPLYGPLDKLDENIYHTFQASFKIYPEDATRLLGELVQEDTKPGSKHKVIRAYLRKVCSGNRLE